MKHFRTRKTNIRLLFITPRQKKNKTPKIHDDQEIMLSSQNQKNVPLAMRTKYMGMLNPENQLQMSLMKLNGIDIWPTPTMMNAVKSYLGFGNFDEEFTQNVQSLIKPQNELNNED